MSASSVNNFSRRAMTLVELLVSMAIMVLMIAGVGYVFSESSQLVDITASNSRLNSIVRSLDNCLREDVRAAAGVFTAVIEPADDDLPPVLIFITNGRYKSQAHDGSISTEVTANAALTVYYFARQNAQPDGEYVLCRSRFLLAGRSDYPASFADLFAWQRSLYPDDINLLDNVDVLGASLGDIFDDVAARHMLNNFFIPLVQEIYDCDASGAVGINMNPLEIDAPENGGVKQMWPILTTGVEDMEISFCDGYQDDYITPSDRLNWLDIDRSSIAARRRFDYGSLPTDRRLAWIPVPPGAPPCSLAYWAATPKEFRPKAIRISLTVKSDSSHLENPYRQVDLICAVE